MKLTNYKRGYNSVFDCSIHGTITMNETEYLDAIRYLRRARYDYRMKLDDDIERAIYTRDGFYINVRCTATGKLAERYHLTNYKQGNYQIHVMLACDLCYHGNCSHWCHSRHGRGDV